MSVCRMVISRYILLATLLWTATVQADDKLFQERIASILETRCIHCHSGAKPKGALSLVSAQSLQRGGESGPAIVAGRPDESLLVQYISGEDPAMPQESEPLSSDEVETIRQWIERGAVWPAGIELVDKRQYDLNWWSLRPLARPETPAVQSSWIRTPIDAFILAKLDEQGLAPVARGRSAAR